MAQGLLAAVQTSPSISYHLAQVHPSNKGSGTGGS